MPGSMLLGFFSFLSLLEPIVAQGYSYSTGDQPISPIVLPSPNATGQGEWAAAFSKAAAFASQLTLEEKVSMLTGEKGPCVGNIPPIPRVGFNGLCLQDGPLAIRQSDYSSVFPAGLSAAASWDADLVYQRGVEMGAEFKGKGAHAALGPVCGPLGRHALGGRNWEGFSPDPYLTGQMIERTIIGMQQSGVQATVKHYIGNEQETQRNPSTPKGSNTTIQAVSSNIDDRTMHELYLWPFSNAVKAGVSAIMCSYNRINETYACENSKSLNGILKGELNFQGYVMSDWQATHSGVPAVNAGLDMNMPGSIGNSPNASFFGGNLTQAVTNGSLSESRLDDMVRRVMTPYYFLGQDNYPSVDPSSSDLNNFDPSTSPYQYDLSGSKHRDVRADHAALIRELGSASAVLLKNTNGTLPLKAPKNIGVFGNDAADESDGLYSPSDSPRNNYGYNFGALFVGGGSGAGRLSYLVSPLEAVKARGRQDGALVQYVTNNAVVSNPLTTVYPTPEVCLVFLKTYVTEGSDRTSYLADWNSTAVVTSVTQLCNNTIVITNSGGANTMPWADNPNVTAIIAAHLPGQEIGNAIVDVLYGAVNPSAKLPYTIGLNESDYNAPVVNVTATTNVTDQDQNAWQSPFTEGLLIDYRHFDAANITPRYEFGFGLSYTTFSISNLKVGSPATLTPYPAPESPPLPGGNSALYTTVLGVSVSVSNTGSVAGATVPQLYLSMPQDAVPDGTPAQVLRGFDKVLLQPGQSQDVTFELVRKDVSFWDVLAQDWRVPAGELGISVCFSSRDVVVRGSVKFL